jgi:hypothetical protein
MGITPTVDGKSACEFQRLSDYRLHGSATTDGRRLLVQFDERNPIQ